MTQFRVIEHKPLAKDIYRLELGGDTSAVKRAGQFVNLQLKDFYLRRPISIADYNDNSLTLIYKVLGEGTKVMTKLSEGADLDILVGLGNGFDSTQNYKQAILVGGGVGVPPLYRLAKDLAQKGEKPIIILGFNTAEDIFYLDEFASIPNAKVYVATMDGSYGVRGTVIDLINSLEDQNKVDYLYACGPTPMLKALHRLGLKGQFSLEERMGCGFGACMGCSHKMKSGAKRICYEGPVFSNEELLW